MTDPQSFVLLHGFLGSPEVFGDVELQLKKVLAPKVSCAFHALTISGHEISGSETLRSDAPRSGREAPRSDDETPNASLRGRGGGQPFAGADFEAEVTRLLSEVTRLTARGPIAHAPTAHTQTTHAQTASAQVPGPPVGTAPNTPHHRPHLVGYSLGGRLALGMALREPSRFRSLTLISTHPGLASSEARTERCQSDERWARLLEEHGLNVFLDAWEKQPLFASQAYLSPAILTEQKRLRRRHQPDELARALRQLSLGRMPNYGERLAELTLPVLLITGSLDAKFQRVAEAMREKLPHSKHHSYPGIGHNVVLEDPSDLARQLAHFALDNF